MFKWPLEDTILSTLGKQVVTTHLIPASAELQQPEHEEVNIVSEQKDEDDAAPVASMKESN
jgi:hypothetical protein